MDNTSLIIIIVVVITFVDKSDAAEALAERKQKEFWQFEVNFWRAVKIRKQLGNRSSETPMHRNTWGSFVKMCIK